MTVYTGVNRFLERPETLTDKYNCTHQYTIYSMYEKEHCLTKINNKLNINKIYKSKFQKS